MLALRDRRRTRPPRLGRLVRELLEVDATGRTGPTDAEYDAVTSASCPRCGKPSVVPKAKLPEHRLCATCTQEEFESNARAFQVSVLPPIPGDPDWQYEAYADMVSTLAPRPTPPYRGTLSVLGARPWSGRCAICGLRPVDDLLCDGCAEWYETETAKTHRRMGQLARAVALIRIVGRDGTTCSLCGGAVDVELDDGPNMPSIDHIVLFAHGGSHALSNLRLAHLHCNVERKDAMP